MQNKYIKICYQGSIIKMTPRLSPSLLFTKVYTYIISAIAFNICPDQRFSSRRISATWTQKNIYYIKKVIKLKPDDFCTLQFCLHSPSLILNLKCLLLDNGLLCHSFLCFHCFKQSYSFYKSRTSCKRFSSLSLILENISITTQFYLECITIFRLYF